MTSLTDVSLLKRKKVYRNFLLNFYILRIKLRIIFFIEKKISSLEQTQNTDTHTITEVLYQTNHHSFRCGICRGAFRMNRGLLQHLSFCRPRHSDEQQTDIDSNDQRHNDGDKKSFYWRN